jgi:uncharacterized repeat protein (TIGR01451 family)
MTLRASPFRALPITVAFLLNVVVGPLAPITQLAAPVLALGNSSFNALDGNLVDDGANETDWCTPAPNLQIGTDSPSGSNDTSFASNNNKEDSNVPTLSQGTIPNNKDDLLREYIASETVGEDLFVYLAWVRADSTGTSTIDFEFNQSDQISSNGTTKVRTDGDLLVTFDFQANPGSQGGYNVELTLRTWDNDASDQPDPTSTPPNTGKWVNPIDLVASGLAEGSVNDDTVSDCVANPNVDLPVATFGEAVLNLTAILGGDCEAFGSLFTKSRSSNSFSADLKDRINPLPVDLSTCGQITILKDDENGDPLGGATFSVTPNPFTGSGSLSVTDNVAPDDDAADGVIHLSAVEPDEYEVCETDAPDGYIIDTTCQTLTVSQNGSAQFGPFVNGLGDISWEKVDEQSGEKICCATFTLEGIAGAADGFGPLTVTDNGQNDEDSDVGELLVTGLLLGTYRITETVAPDGYDLPSPAFKDVVLNGETALPDAAFQDPPQADASISKDAVLSPIVAGETASFDIEVTAGGTGTSEDVMLTDLNETDHTWTVSGPDSGDCADVSIAPGETLSCDFGDLANGASREITISMTSDADDCELGIANTATVSSSNDHDASNNEDSASITVLCPNPGVVKDAQVTPIVFGEDAVFTVTVTAGGTGAAKNVVLTDLNDTGHDWTVSGADSSACVDLTVADGETLSCTWSEIAAGQSRSITITMTSGEEDCQLGIDNTASIEADADVDESNDEDSTHIAVLCPNPGVVKTAELTPITAGDPASFDIVVSASGTGDSENVVLTDTNETSHTWAISGADAGDCADLSVEPGEDLSCDFGTIPNGSTRTVTITMESDADDCANGIDNTASITADADTDESNNESSASIEVECPDVVVDKTGSGTVNATDSIFFEITVSNAGEGDAYDFLFSDTLPDVANGWTLVQPAEAGCALNALALSCSKAVYEAGDSFILRLEANTEVADCGDLPNLAEASASNEAQDDLGNNSDDHTIVVQCPNLSASKEADDDVVSAGEQIGFTITVTNSDAPGTGTAYDVLLSDLLPAGSDLAWSEDPDSAACQINGSVGAQTLECNFGDLAAGASASVHVVSDTTQLDCATFPNVASVTSTNHPELNPSADTTVECPGLNISKIADNGQIVAGETASYTIVVWNTGPGTAFDASWSDELPHGVNWSVELLNPDGDDACASSIDSEGNQAASCQFGDLAVTSMANGKMIVVSGETDRDDCAGLDNTAFAFASNADTVQATAFIGVRCPELVIEKSADTEVVHFVFDADGNVLSVDPEQVTWTLTYTLTNGPVTDAVITDPLPEFLVFVSASDGGVYDPNTGIITWELGDLIVDGSDSVSFVTTVDPAAPEGDPIVNVATIVSNETPEDDGEDSIIVTSESELGGTPTPKPSVPNTAVVFGPAGEPISIPVELLAFVFIGSLGALAYANVRATRRRR